MNSQSFKSDLRTDLPALSEKTLERLWQGAYQARGYQLALKELHSQGNFKTVKEELPRLHRALVKISEQKGTQQAAIKSLEAALDSAQRYCPGVFCELDAVNDLQGTMPVDIRRSAFERHVARLVEASPGERPKIADELSEVTADYIKNLKKPGRGGARRQAQQYTEGLHELARQFNEALPHQALSADPNSVFYRYALQWLNHYMKASISDPQRHIQNALDTYTPTGKTPL